MIEKTYSLQDVAKETGFAIGLIRKAVRAKKLVAFWIGNTQYVKQSELEKWHNNLDKEA